MIVIGGYGAPLTTLDMPERGARVHGNPPDSVVDLAVHADGQVIGLVSDDNKSLEVAQQPPAVQPLRIKLARRNATR